MGAQTPADCEEVCCEGEEDEEEEDVGYGAEREDRGCFGEGEGVARADVLELQGRAVGYGEVDCEGEG